MTRLIKTLSQNWSVFKRVLALENSPRGALLRDLKGKNQPLSESEALSFNLSIFIRASQVSLRRMSTSLVKEKIAERLLAAISPAEFPLPLPPPPAPPLCLIALRIYTSHSRVITRVGIFIISGDHRGSASESINLHNVSMDVCL